MARAKSVAKELSEWPGEAGYCMPPEWRTHAATWLAFPHHRTDFPGKLAAVVHTFAEMARVITQGERVRLLVKSKAEQARAAGIFERAGVDMTQLDFIGHDTNRSWTRDSMPIWVTRKKSSSGADKVAVKFRFNGWARYRDHLLDDAAGRHVAEKQAACFYRPRDPDGAPVVLEGGSIDVDEVGTMLTTEACLLTSSRARFSRGKAQAEETLSRSLGVKKVIWLPDGIAGDDTSGHVDDFARFAPGGRVLICHEPKKSDVNHVPLAAAARALRGAENARGKKLEIVQLPMPDPVFYGGDRLPASYANFYVCNFAVLVPVFNDHHDQEALSIISDCFRDRKVVGIYARDLVVGLGTLHCSTMQEPAP